MAHAVIAITIDATAEQVFDVVHDYEIRTDWDTLLRSARMEGNRVPEQGAVAVCAARWYLGGLVFRTRYVTFNRPVVAAVTLVKPYFIFENWSASIRHREVAGLGANSAGDGASEVIYTLNLRCRPTRFARPLEVVAMKAFELETRRRLRALKRYIEADGKPSSGSWVTRTRRPRLT